MFDDLKPPRSTQVAEKINRPRVVHIVLKFRVAQILVGKWNKKQEERKKKERQDTVTTEYLHLQRRHENEVASLTVETLQRGHRTLDRHIMIDC